MSEHLALLSVEEYEAELLKPLNEQSFVMKQEVQVTLDKMIQHWRGQRSNSNLGKMAPFYIDALQSVRRNLLGSTLPFEEEKVRKIMTLQQACAEFTEGFTNKYFVLTAQVADGNLQGMRRAADELALLTLTFAKNLRSAEPQESSPDSVSGEGGSNP